MKETAQPKQGVSCPVCGLTVHETGLVRCPRCNNPLLTPTGCSGSCSKCLMKSKSCGH